MARTAAKKFKAAAKDDKTRALAVTDAPRLTDRKAAQARFAEWLAETGRKPAGKALKSLLAASPKVEALLLGLADGSPYLWDLAAAAPATSRARIESSWIAFEMPYLANDFALLTSRRYCSSRNRGSARYSRAAGPTVNNAS